MKKKVIQISLTLFQLTMFLSNFCQTDSTNKTSKIVHVHGKVYDQTNKHPLPFVGVTIQSIKKGTSTSNIGSFFISCYSGDTLQFSFIGYKNLVLPIQTDTGTSLFLEVFMKEDTILLKEKEVYPWPSREQFKDAFVNTNLPSSEQQIAMKNLDQNILNGKMNAYELPLYERNYKTFLNEMDRQRKTRYKISPFQDMFTVGKSLKSIKKLVKKKKPIKLL